MDITVIVTSNGLWSYDSGPIYSDCKYIAKGEIEIDEDSFITIFGYGDTEEEALSMLNLKVRRLKERFGL